MDNINKICKAILKLKDSEVSDARKEFNSQESYASPLKIAIQHRENKLGEYNNKVLSKIEELKTIIKAGEELQ